MPPPIVYAPRPWYAILGLASVILGFLGLVLSWMQPFGLVLAAVGLLLGAVGWATGVGRTRAQPGMVILGTILSLISFILNILFITGGVTYLTTRLPGY